MQRILLLLTFVIYYSSTFSQSLEGQWEGWCSTTDSKDTAIFKLQFQLNKDSTYNVYSFTKFKTFKGVCKMSYKMLGIRSIYLEEIEAIRSTVNSLTESSFQKMTLEITNGFRTMRGKWQSKDVQLKGSGDIYILKSN